MHCITIAFVRLLVGVHFVIALRTLLNPRFSTIRREQRRPKSALNYKKHSDIVSNATLRAYSHVDVEQLIVVRGAVCERT